MPLVQHNNLPSIERVRTEGVDVCASGELDTSLASIKIGFLNMMPDAAISATERQFLRLVGANDNVNCFFYPFTIQGVERSAQAQTYIDEYYVDFATLKTHDVDALIITGANVSQPVLQNELFWPQLVEVLTWAKNNIRSTLCSCLATHAAVKVFYDIDRQHLGEKCWGVFKHQVVSQQHLLVDRVQKQIDMCHSRFNDIPEELLVKHNIDTLINSSQVGVQLAAERDMSIVYFQGHPEYDDISLLKEYKREIMRYIFGELESYPPVPVNYFDQNAMKFISDYKTLLEQTQLDQLADKRSLLEDFPEQELRQYIGNPWKNSSATIFSNWIDFVAG